MGLLSDDGIVGDECISDGDAGVPCRLVQQLNLGPLIASWANNLLSQESVMEDVGPQCARLLSALVIGMYNLSSAHIFHCT